MSHKDMYGESTEPDIANFYRLRRQNRKVPSENQENDIREQHQSHVQKVFLRQPEKTGRK